MAKISLLEFIGARFIKTILVQHRIKFSMLAAPMLLIGCAPEFRPTMAVPQVAPIVKYNPALKNRRYDASVFIHQFSDARTAEAIAEYEGREIKPQSAVVENIVSALRRGLESRGYRFSERAPVLIAGEIRKWMAHINGGFKSKVDAQAALYIEIFDPANKRIYSGIYSGYAMLEKTGLEEKDVQEVLATAMAEAMGRVLSDAQFNRLISSY